MKLRQLLLAGAALLALTTAGNAAVVASLGTNPTSAQGHFSNEVGGSTFTDDYTFTLSDAAPAYITFASATNDHATADDFISNFTGQLFLQVGAVAGDGNDIPVNAPVSAVGCPGNPDGCQILAGTATLTPGNYFLELSGTGGGSAGYGGNLTVTAAVPEPATWFMMILGFAGVGLYGMRKRRQDSVGLTAA
jgi:PEP-CTERM motif-containing protein